MYVYIYIYTGCKKFRIQTLRVCRGDKMKPYCYVTNIWQVLRFLARGPWRVWRRMVLQKLFKCLEITLSLFVTYYRKCWRMSRYKSGNDYGSSMKGPQYTLPLMSENIWTMFFPIVGLGGVVQYSGHHVLLISLLWISLSGWGDEVFGVRDTDRHSRRDGCPCGRSCSNYSWETIICTQIPPVH